MTSVYVRAQSKAAINRKLAEGGDLTAYAFSPYGRDVHELSSMPDGTAVKVFRDWHGASPSAAIAYGTIKRDKAGKIKVA